MPKFSKLILILLLGLTIFHFNETEALSVENEKVLQSRITNDIVARKYVLGPNDVITVDVYENLDFKQEKIPVQPDGKITLVPIGTIKVTGLTVDELKDLLVEKFKIYINNPQVTIKLEKSKPFIVYVTGAVLNPGSYEIGTDLNSYYAQNTDILIQRKTPILTNILVAAGGLSYDADIENIEIKNTIENSNYKVDLLDLIENGNSDQDIYLISGDRVFIPKLPTPLAISEEKYKKYAGATFSPKNVPVKVYGYVNRPGLIQLNASQSLNLNSAIMAAGGYPTNAAYSPSKVFISRSDASGKLVTKVVNPKSNDVVVLPNDIIYIPEKPRQVVGKFFDFLGRIIAPASSFSDAYKKW